MVKEEKYRSIAFFPLGVFLLPGEDIPLRIFEPRYKQLIGECRQTDITFGIPFYDGVRINTIGCEVKLSKVIAENTNGNLIITIKSIGLFNMINFHEKLPGKLYGGGQIEELIIDTFKPNDDLRQLIHVYKKATNQTIMNVGFEEKMTIIDLMKNLNLPAREKVHVINLNYSERYAFLASYIKYLLYLRQLETRIGNDYQLN